MKTVHLILSLALCLGITACSGKKNRVERPGLPPDARQVAEAILNNDSTQFADLMYYPIARPYPLHDVETKDEMISYYNTLVDEPLRQTVEQAPDSAWHEDGWRGMTLDDGRYLHIDDGRVYRIDYVSQRETELLDSLRTAELLTLEPSMRDGWVPVACAIDTVSDAVFRIDFKRDTEPQVYRLAGYATGTDLSGTPTIILYGTLELEGSMGNRFYHFSDQEGTTAEYEPDACSDDDNPSIRIDTNGRERHYRAKPGYWLDHIRHR